MLLGLQKPTPEYATPLPSHKAVRKRKHGWEWNYLASNKYTTFELLSLLGVNRKSVFSLAPKI